MSVFEVGQTRIYYLNHVFSALTVTGQQDAQVDGNIAYHPASETQRRWFNDEKELYDESFVNVIQTEELFDNVVFTRNPKFKREDLFTYEADPADAPEGYVAPEISLLESQVPLPELEKALDAKLAERLAVEEQLTAVRRELGALEDSIANLGDQRTDSERTLETRTRVVVGSDGDYEQVSIDFRGVCVVLVGLANVGIAGGAGGNDDAQHCRQDQLASVGLHGCLRWWVSILRPVF